MKSDEHPLTPGEKWDAGSIQLETPGVVIVTIGQGDTHRLRSSSLWLYKEQHLVETPWTRDAEDSYRSGPLQPGSYSVRADGAGLACMEQEFKIERGTETNISLTVDPAVQCKICVRWPAGSPPFRTLEIVVRRADEQVVLRRESPKGVDNQEFFSVGLPLGRYTIEAKTETGLRAANEFSIDDFTPSTLLTTFDLH